MEPRQPSLKSQAELEPVSSLQRFLTALPIAVYCCHHNDERTMEFVSVGIQKLAGYPPEAFMQPHHLSLASLIHPDDMRKALGAVANAVERDASFEVEYRLRCADGSVKWIWEQGIVSKTGDGTTAMLEGLMLDITRMRAAELALHEQASYLAHARDAIVVTTVDSTVIYWNRGAERLYGWTAVEACGRAFREYICESSEEHDTARAATMACGEWAGELTHRQRDGSTVEVETRWTLLAADDRSGAQQKILMISTDISERKQTEAQIRQMAFHDALTGLPNRAHFLNDLHQTLVGSARTGRFGALLFCDLDNFKIVNDTQGHAAGDSLLQAVAQRLRHCVREADMVARLGGDEFVVLLQAAEDSSAAAALQAEAVAAKIVHAMSSPIEIIDLTLRVSASVGVTIFCGRDNSVESVLSQADAAMYQAKTSGRSTFRFYDTAIQAQWAARAELEKDLVLALSGKEFMLYYQPQLDLQNRIIGAEALLRWRRSSGELVYPNEFIKVAEESRLIIEIGNWVLRTACRQLARWQRDFATAHITLSVNVSPRQFTDAGFIASLEEIIDETGVDPSGLKFELTENLLIHDFEKTAEVMGLLKQRGIGFSLDDFGTGYSSLAYLRKLPVDQLKIDHFFMRDVLTDHADASIVRSIIGLAVNLGLQVIAEGVETIGQRNFLSGAGCEYFQGFFYNRAISANEFARYLNRHE